METVKEKTAEHQAIKKICITFFYWWYNTKGSNTEQGFDDWMESADAKELVEQFASLRTEQLQEQNIRIAGDLREVLDVLQKRIDNPNSMLYLTSDLKECWNTVSETINKLEKEMPLPEPPKI